MNKMTFIIPCYNAKVHIERNINMWKEISNSINLVWIEDTDKPELIDLVRKIGGKHFTKKNGNWGSVINFAVENNLVKTDYVAIVDPDDYVESIELDKLLTTLETNDLYITKYIIKDFITSKKNLKSYRFDKYSFIHQLWMSKDIFNSLPTLPEGVPFTDNIVVNHILSNSKNSKNVNCAPYIYFINFENQSTSGGLPSIKNKIKQANIIASAPRSNKAKSLSLRNRLKVANAHIKYQKIILIRAAYEAERNKENRKEILKIYKKEKNFWVPIRFMMIWSKLYVMIRGNNE